MNIIKWNYWACRVMCKIFPKIAFIYIVYDNTTGECNYVSNILDRNTIAGIIGDLNDRMEGGSGVVVK